MSLIETALRLINEHGVAVSLVRNTATVNKITGSKTTTSETSHETHGVEETEKHTIEGAFGAIASSHIYYMLSSQVEPMIGDTMVVGSKTYSVTEYKPTYFKGAAVYYMVSAKK